ncbi:6076_t:CDS:2, partial [Paraglomus occultum]
MHVLEAQSALLSNFEVLEVLRELAQNMLTVGGRTWSIIMQYLASDQSLVESQTAEQIKNLLEALKPYLLTKNEKLRTLC